MPLRFLKFMKIFQTESDHRYLPFFYDLVLCRLFELHKSRVMGRKANLAIALSKNPIEIDNCFFIFHQTLHLCIFIHFSLTSFFVPLCLLFNCLIR